MVTLGFIGSREMQGVTSLCRFRGLGPNGYYMFLHFFRVSSWSLDALIGCWCAFVLSQNQVIYSNGRAVLFGDHTCVAEDGRCGNAASAFKRPKASPPIFEGTSGGQYVC